MDELFLRSRNRLLPAITSIDSSMLEPHLRRAQDVTSGNQGDVDAVDVDRLVVVEKLQARRVTEPGAEDACAFARCEVLF